MGCLRARNPITHSECGWSRTRKETHRYPSYHLKIATKQIGRQLSNHLLSLRGFRSRTVAEPIQRSTGSLSCLRNVRSDAAKMTWIFTGWSSSSNPVGHRPDQRPLRVWTGGLPRIRRTWTTEFDEFRRGGRRPPPPPVCQNWGVGPNWRIRLRIYQTAGPTSRALCRTRPISTITCSKFTEIGPELTNIGRHRSDRPEFDLGSDQNWPDIGRICHEIAQILPGINKVGPNSSKHGPCSTKRGRPKEAER